jgi:hypothetical protein
LLLSLTGLLPVSLTRHLSASLTPQGILRYADMPSI